ncbi:MAG: nucleotide exchange factor GrpE [Dehalococcoidia bacterium]|nr:nucleotide exchange factor GrpE [Dehalococcoidia bacterium]
MAEEPVSQEQDTIDELKKALTEAEEKASTYLADAQRERADYQNLKKRTEQEKQEYQAWSNAEMVKQLLPVIDDMERAFNMVDPKFKDSTWVEGFRIIQRNLQDILRTHGCTAIECVGQAFDPSFHEAIAYEDGDEGIIVSEHRKGYTIKDKVLRASQVTVGKGNNTGAGSDNKCPDDELTQ